MGNTLCGGFENGPALWHLNHPPQFPYKTDANYRSGDIGEESSLTGEKSAWLSDELSRKMILAGSR